MRCVVFVGWLRNFIELPKGNEEMLLTALCVLLVVIMLARQAQVAHVAEADRRRGVAEDAAAHALLVSVLTTLSLPLFPPPVIIGLMVSMCLSVSLHPLQ